MAIGLFQHCGEQLFLAAEVMIDHPLVGAGARCNFIDAGAAQALAGKFSRRRCKDGLPGHLRIPAFPRSCFRHVLTAESSLRVTIWLLWTRP